MTTATTTTAATGFEALLDECEIVMKAMPAVPVRAEPPAKPKLDAEGKPVMGTDGKPVMEAVPSAAAPPATTAATAPATTEEEEPFGKSFTVQMADGTEQEVLDATEMMKALNDDNKKLSERAAKLEAGLSKSAALNVALGKKLTEQGVLLKSLHDSVESMGSKPGGRRAVLNLLDKPATTTTTTPAAEITGVNAEEFMNTMAKCFAAGKLSGDDVNLAEAYVGRGLQPPKDLIERVATAASS